MNEYLTALCLGAAAGAVALVPLTLRRAALPTMAATFAQWLLLGLAIPFVEWSLPPLLTGLLFGVSGMIPLLFLYGRGDRQAVVTTVLYGAGLGTVLGLTGSLLIE
ncbi:MAG: hypothetical protein R3E86_16335 [Pseudomonadales bacterium]